MSDDDTSRVIAPQSPRRLTRLFLLVVVPAALVLSGTTFYYAGGRYVTTENAYVKAPIVSIVSQVAGRVAEVHVSENEIVAPGQKLVQLERGEFELAVEEARAILVTVAQEIENRRAELRQAEAEIKVAQERRRYLEGQYQREQTLAKNGIGLQTKLDEAQHLLRAADRGLAAAQERERGILAMLGGDADIPVEEHPRYVAAEARLDRALLDLKRSTLTASVGGVIAKMNLDTGEFIKSGEPLFAIVQTGNAWVEANLKETELTHIRPGQKATFVVEAYPDVTWTAEVVGISPATGAEFSVLPPQNASGNWVKVVQRLPVRLSIDTDDAAAKPALRAGMSVRLSVDTGHVRRAPPVISEVLAATRTIVGSSPGK